MKKIIDISNQEFNGVKVLMRDYEKEKLYKNNKTYWKCQCHCGNYFTTSGENLRSGNTKSCGCRKSMLMSLVGRGNSKQNKWEFIDNTAIGYTLKNEKFMIDLEDYNKVKKYCWRIDNFGYVVANKKDTTNKNIKIHRIIMDAKMGECIDHKNWDKLNNCKNNLRTCSKSQNNINIKRKSNNNSGYTGVKKEKRTGKWTAQISYNNKRIHLGTFGLIEDAVYARHIAENIIHNQFNGEINRNDLLKFIQKEAQEETI